MTIFDNIKNGKYEPDLPYPQKPQKPAALNTVAGKLDDATARRLPAIRKQYEQDMAEYTKARDAYRSEQRRLAHDVFYGDLCKEHGMDPKHPFAEKLYERLNEAFDGFNDVACYFEDFASLWNIAVEHGMSKEAT